MNTRSVNISLIGQPSALIPLAMSFTALALVLVNAAIFGVVHEADEGTAAHVFQVLMIAQLPIIAYFAIKWLPRQPKQSLRILALQAGVWVATIAAVYCLT
jgi:hypothetical protein